ncbi:MAG: SHOCT domain-containing protein [Actinobacteria bacterium]|nr:MAG: SHOCT domain-containing protein [Actinomycetota bacterium]
MMHDYGLGGGFFMLLMGLFWLLLLIGVIILVVYFVNQSRRTPSRGEELALDILKQRYAKGEIDKKEFEEKKKDLL